MADDFGIEADAVMPLVDAVRKFRQAIIEDIRAADGGAAVERSKSVVAQLNQAYSKVKSETPGILSETMASFLKASVGEGQSAAIFHTGFLGLGAEQLSNQMMLHVAAETIASNRADLLGALVQDRAASSTPTVADIIIYSAIIAGIQDNPDFHHTGADTELRTAPAYAARLMALAASPNPVYRLLAITLAPRLEYDPRKLEVFYASLAAEADPFVRQTAVDMIKASNPPNLPVLLQRFGD
ncbi:MAG TPA: hypothetical protein VD994_14730 [Prosthecobacter sp.]|nr:hypothetical protein [Prosthecobacter sp.]